MGSMTLRSIILPVVFILILLTAGCGTTSASRTGNGTVMGDPAIDSMSGNAAMDAHIGRATRQGGFLYNQHRR